MTDYPSTSPWGPHGPQVPANSVTPNPTAQTPPGMPTPTSYAQPDYTAGYGGGSTSQGTAYAPAPPRPKSMVLAVVLTLVLGPIGLPYTAGTRTRFLLALFFMGYAVLSLLLSRTATWAPYVVISVIWAVFNVRSYNKRFNGG